MCIEMFLAPVLCFGAIIASLLAEVVNKTQQQQQVAAAVGCTNLHFRFLASISNLKLLTFLADISLLLFFAISETFAGWFDNAAWHSSRFDQRSCRNCRIPERPVGKRVRVKPQTVFKHFFGSVLGTNPFMKLKFGVQHVHELLVEHVHVLEARIAWFDGRSISFAE